MGSYFSDFPLSKLDMAMSMSFYANVKEKDDPKKP